MDYSPLITDYESAVRFMRKSTLKKLRSWATMIKKDDTFYFMHDHVTFASLTSDNVLTFLISPLQGATISRTMAGSLSRVLPVLWRSTGTSTFELLYHRDDPSGQLRYQYYVRERWAKTGQELFAGVAFDLSRGCCINARPRLTSSTDSERNLLWLRALRRFKRGIAVRAKLGVLDTLCERAHDEIKSGGRSAFMMNKPDWVNPKWVDYLYRCIRDGEYTDVLLNGFVKSSHVNWWRGERPTKAHVIDTVDDVCNKLSVELRKRFGVFGDPYGEEQKTNQEVQTTSEVC